MSVVWPAQGTTIGVDEISGASNSFSLVNNVTSITGIGGGTVTQALTSALASTVHTFRATIKKPGEVACDLWFDPTDAVHKFVRNLADSPSNGPNTWLATMNTGNTNSTCQFVGSGVSDWTGYNVEDVEDNLAASFSVQQTGLPTWVNST
jgi:hypothetical protein